MKKIFLIAILASFAFVDLSAQPSGTGDGDGPTDAAPIDGGITLLLAAGAIYGTKRHLKK